MSCCCHAVVGLPNAISRVAKSTVLNVAHNLQLRAEEGVQQRLAKVNSSEPYPPTQFKIYILGFTTGGLLNLIANLLNEDCSLDRLNRCSILSYTLIYN